MGFFAAAVSAVAGQGNPLMDERYAGVLKGKEHELLHVHYGAKKERSRAVSSAAHATVSV